MKKIIIVAVLAIVGAVTFFYLKSKPKFGGKLSTSANQKPVKEVFLAPRPKATVESVVLETGCKDLLTSLEQVDFNQSVVEWKPLVPSDKLKACKSSPSYEERITNLENKCADPKAAKSCESELLFLRSILRSESISDPQTQEEIADHIIAQFAKDPDFSKLTMLAEKMLDIDPNRPAIQKLWAISKFISNVSAQSMSDEFVEEIYYNLDPAVWNDPQMRGLDIILKSKMEPKAAESYIKQQLKKHPEDKTSRELLTWSLWQQNKRDEAIQQLDELRKTHPQDQWYQEMYQKVTARDADINSYQYRLSIGFTFDDLFQ